MATTFDKLGGSPAISLVVDTFYDTMLADPETMHFFKTTDMTRQRQMQKDFITMALGGPNNYKGKDMTEAHKHLKITQKDFDNVWGHLERSMKAHKVSEELVKEVKDVFYSVQEECVTVK